MIKVWKTVAAAMTVVLCSALPAHAYAYASAPPTPKNVVVSDLQYSTVTLSWDKPSASAKIVDYKISYYYPDPGVTPPVYHLVKDGYSNTPSVTIKNLNLADSFKFNIAAVNNNGVKSAPAVYVLKTLTPNRPTTADAKVASELDFVYKYWNDRTGLNHKYMYIKANNCTNWISQVLHEGYGLKMDSHWYYYNTEKRSPSWTSQSNLYNYMKTYHKEWKRYTDREMKHATLGTYISFDWYPGDGSRNHGAIVTFIEDEPNGSRHVYYAGSTTHTIYRSVEWVTSVRRPQGVFEYFVPPVK